MSNALIYGKNDLSRIVSIEVGDSTAEVFRELEDGTVTSTQVPASHYMLFTEQHSPKLKRLAGDQPYKWLYETDSLEKYNDVVSASYKKRYDFFRIRDSKEALMVREGYTYFKGMKAQEVSLLSFDLEHGFGVGSELDKNGELFLIATTFRKMGQIKRKMFSVDEYSNEAEMLKDFCSYVREINPSLVIGFNVLSHDFMVLRYAFKRAGVSFNLGRNGSPVKFADKASKFRKDGSQAYDYTNALIYGREIVDVYFLAMKYDIARNYESYAMKAIIKHERLERPGRVHYDASKIKQDWYDLEKRKQIKEYAIDDADDPLKLFDLMVPSLFYYTQSIPRSFQSIINSATGSQINGLMVRAYLQQGHSIARGSDAVEFEGAISFGHSGIHKNVLRLDIASLYPSVMRQYKIYNKAKDPQALFSQIVEYFTIERLNNKRLGKETNDRYYKDLEQAQKIVINSCYGFLGAPKVNYNFPEGAAEVTRHGRRILQFTHKFLTGKEYEPNSEVLDEVS